MEFLLECVGFPPGSGTDDLIEVARRRGEPVAWRGPAGEHLRLDLGGGLELRLDREEGQDFWTLMPFFRSPYRIRVGVTRLGRVPDSPYDALLVGWVDPPAPDAPPLVRGPGAYLLATWLTDARRLPTGVGPGSVLAATTAGFAIDVTFVGPNEGVRHPDWLEQPSGFSCQPLGGSSDPGGCSELSARVQSLRHMRNPLTGEPVDVLEIDAPVRPLHLFLSPWQLAAEGLPAPRPGWRVEGTFLFTGRIAGALPRGRGR